VRRGRRADGPSAAPVLMTKPVYNVAHVLPWPSVGGTELATLRIARAVGGEQFAHTAFCLKGADAVRELFEGGGFETAEYEAVEPSYRRPKNYLRASWRLAREFRRRGVALVHCADVAAGYYASLAGRLAGVPVLCHVRNRFADLSRRDLSFLRPVSRFAFVSRDTWRHFALKVGPRRGVVVYDGFDAAPARASGADGRDARREWGVPDDCKLVGMVARVAPQKDYRTLARAAARVVADYPRVRFVVVGDYEAVEAHRRHYEEVRGWLRESGVEQNFVFAGFREDVAGALSAMDIFVLCTHHEGLPLVLLEAMAHALPVVATSVDGVPEVVLDGETGLLHAHEDDAGLAAHLTSLLRDEARAAALGEAGRRFVESNFNREQFARSMTELYRDMLGEGAAARRGAEGFAAAGAVKQSGGE
jgi:glycosyltransferase involved in cell wall biosynthesis